MTAQTLSWQKSTYSGEEGDCVELAVAKGGAVLIRESDEPGVVLSTTPSALARFLHAIKRGAAGS
ncbi:DUF397 domain-containing protein [Actinacidiphila epipremni]|jgi:hypothetical protein|uniref:DUF397 domain-containing protein n=1 Tax=Actinacidiphila epipremni TaxID=2053013 RepID=A0ABX0ZL14_9ACTN|nr:DUF397 domain-containing protein [Actinacidiphila epipremni]NJP42338.1 DUF397 domain-containing protein [Actinacidiphila epipremni]